MSNLPRTAADGPRHYDASFIGGRWLSSRGGATLAVSDSYSEACTGVVHLAPVAHIDAAVAQAAAALPAWSATPAAERAIWLRKIGQGLAQRADALAAGITSEVGMPLRLAVRIQVQAPVAAWESYAELAVQQGHESRIGHTLVTAVPVGVVACITPWNYPLHQITAKVAAALAAGCTVVLKPSELAPSSAYALAEVIEAAELPAGVFNLVFGDGPNAGHALVSHPAVDMVSFTGSTQVGRQVGANAAAGVKRLALELGGKSASLVLDDADLALAVKHTLASCMLNSGQTCNALTRLIVPRTLLSQTRELLSEGIRGYVMGDPMDKATRLGPLVSAAHRSTVEQHVQQAMDAGAEHVAGGGEVPAQGHFVAPIVLQARPGDRIEQEEVFGPVLTLLTCDDEEEGVAVANGTPYGLAAAVWSASTPRALTVARRLRAGQVDVNGAPFNPRAPFGGFRLSGSGRENGPYGVDEFLEPRAIQLPA